jgi:hypothetical protein
MKKAIITFLTLSMGIAIFSSCSTLNHSMREPNTLLNLNKNDFTLSDQVTGEAKSTKFLGIDWARLFTEQSGNLEGGESATVSISSIPVIGNVIADKTVNYSLFELMKSNPGYDVVLYPQYETKVNKPVLGIGFLGKTTTVKTKARLGKLNK